MSLHINRFIDRIKAADGRGLREITLTTAEARDLHADITKLLLAITTLQDQKTATTLPRQDIEVDGGTF